MAYSGAKLDKASLKILDCLQTNAEMSNADIAAKVGISPTPCWRRTADMKASGIIRNTVVIADPLKLGLTLNVFVHVTMQRQDRGTLIAFEETITRRPEVMECYLMTGEADFLLRIVVEDLQKFHVLMHECLTQIPGVANIRSSFALDQVKYTTALPTAHLHRDVRKGR